MENFGNNPRPLFELPQNKNSNVKNAIAIVSGKGGVGKSFVTAILTSHFAKANYKTAILDADITGPSIPKAFGLNERLKNTEYGTIPAISKSGIKIVSLNLLIDNEKSAVVWRAPMLTGAIRQFWQDISWGEVDYMFIDLPPGTSDAQLTVFQSINLMGIIIITSPQDLVNMIVEKALDMAKKLNIPIIGVIENFSYFKAEDTGNIYHIFGESNTEKILKKYDLELLGKIPINPIFAKYVDEGKIEDINFPCLDKSLKKIIGWNKDEK